MRIDPFFHAPTFTWSYVLSDPASGAAAIIDPALDFDPASACISSEFAQSLARHVEANRLRVDWILETHAHADHLTAASWLKDRLGGRIGIGAGILKVQENFRRLFDLGEEFRADGSAFDHLFADGERFAVGTLEGEVLATPGHTNDSVTYRFGDAAFIGDTMFSPAAGTGRCDFPGGDAALLYRSIQRLYALPDTTRLYLCHDYPLPGGEPRAEVPLTEMRASNIHVREVTGEAEFVAVRTQRDATLAVPRLLYPSLQVNIRAGRLPPAAPNGRTYLKLPLRIDL